MTRSGGRAANQLREIEIVRGIAPQAAGSALIRTGETRVICTASIAAGVPEWRKDSGKGWLTAEYDMLPGATPTRRARNRLDGRTREIERLIGRSIRACIDLSRLGSNTIHLDCDVLSADGGTRTASITGVFVALHDAVRVGAARGLWAEDVLTCAVAAVSAGVVRGAALLDLDYGEDVSAEVDANLVMTDRGEWVEVQATAERGTYSDAQLRELTEVARSGIVQLFELQRRALAAARIG